MEARACLRFVRMSPRKVKIVCDLLRGKKVDLAAAIVANTGTAASEPVAKLLKSAVANAENNHSMDHDKLYVKEIFACPGPILKRMRPVSKGRGHRINKRTSHITIVIGEQED